MTDEARLKPTARLFFALWPDAAVRQQLARHRPDAGRPVTAENLHITLLFLGSVDREQQERMTEAAAGVLAPPFQLQLDRLDHWRRSGIRWLGLTMPPPPLLSLHQQLRAAAEAVGIAVEARQYRPHVTLARNAPAIAAQAIEPIHWDVADFCLVESVTGAGGSRYTVRRRWPLQADVGPAVGGAGATVE
jgi:2'-5' RNA ligase